MKAAFWIAPRNIPVFERGARRRHGPRVCIVNAYRP
jgi:hypothetical protein